MDVLGAGFDAPGGEGVGAEARLEPVGERLRRGEAAVAVVEGHCGNFDESARVGWEIEWGFNFGGGGEEVEDGEGGEEEIG